MPTPAPPLPPRWIVWTALQIEADAILRELRRFPGLPVEVQVIGPCAAQLPNDPPAGAVRGICLAGLGGALDPSLRVGDVVIDGDAALVEAVAAAADGRLKIGGICGSDTLVATPAQKTILRRSSGAAVVDTESHLVRRAARRWALPLLIVRAVSDAADEALDPRTAGLVNAFGRTRYAAVAAFGLRRPRNLLTLARLGAASRRALPALAAAVRGAVEKA